MAKTESRTNTGGLFVVTAVIAGVLWIGSRVGQARAAEPAPAPPPTTEQPTQRTGTVTIHVFGGGHVAPRQPVSAKLLVRNEGQTVANVVLLAEIRSKQLHEWIPLASTMPITIGPGATEPVLMPPFAIAEQRRFAGDWTLRVTAWDGQGNEVGTARVESFITVGA